jgi:hypothetical protein
MGDDASEGSNGTINVRMSEYDCLIKAGISMGIEIRFLCSDFREQNGQLIDAL